MFIERDTHSRGTIDEPQYVIFIRWGRQPAQELWLKAHTAPGALEEAKRRFPGEAFTIR